MVTVALLSSEVVLLVAVVPVVTVVTVVELVQAEVVLLRATLVDAEEEEEEAESVVVAEPEWEAPATKLPLLPEADDAEDEDDEDDEDEAPAVTVTVACEVEASWLQTSLARFSALVRSAALHWAMRQSPAAACSWACFSLRQRQSVSLREQPVSGMALRMQPSCGKRESQCYCSTRTPAASRCCLVCTHGAGRGRGEALGGDEADEGEESKGGLHCEM